MKKTVWFRIWSVVGLAVILLGFSKAVAAPMSAVPFELAWDASPDATVTGYALYFGLAGAPITNRLDAGSAQAVTLANLDANSSYVFFVVAYNAAGVESASSNVLEYRPPVMSRLQISKQADGTMSIQFRTAPGAPCRVEYASTPGSAQWQTLGSTVADANGNVVINDPPAGRSPMRFYRGARL